MIKVDYHEPSSPDWVSWKAAVEAEVATAVGKYQPGDASPEVKDSLDDARKAEIREAFHHKCAYCEALITTTKPGDVRRYRPKSRVYDIEGNLVEVTHGGLRFPHPGYYWLAAEPHNLLYTCDGCSPADEKKRDCFPVQRDDYRSQPGTEQEEVPLLVHPIHDKAEDYFDLDGQFGVLVGKDERAQVSIEVLELNREELRDARLAAFGGATTILERVSNAKIRTADDAKDLSGWLDFLHSSCKAAHPFSFVYRRAMEVYKTRVQPLRNLLEGVKSS